MSELELHIMKGRLERGRKNKALRGGLFHSRALRVTCLQPDKTVAFDPDEQVRATVRRLFDAFQGLGNAFAVVRELRRGRRETAATRNGNGQLLWRIATLTILQTALHHPLYAEALYSWGRRQTRRHVDTSGQINQVPPTPRSRRWSVLLHDHVPAYITWDQYLANQRQLLQNLRRRSTTKGATGGTVRHCSLASCTVAAVAARCMSVTPSRQARSLLVHAKLA